MKLSLLLTLATLVACAAPARSQEAGEEFIATVARFRISLPKQHQFLPKGLDVAGHTFFLSTYNWKLGPDQAVVAYADGTVDMEASPQAGAFLSAIRDAHAGKFFKGSPVAERPISLDGHPGLFSVVQSDAGRAMVWVYLVKNRLYVSSLTLLDAARVEENVKKLSTLKLLTREDLAARYEQMTAELTPPPFPPESGVRRPTTDAVDARLRGKVRRVVTEEEKYFGDKLLGVRKLVSDDFYDEEGNLTKSVLYHGELPHAVRVYGHVKGERVYSEWKRSWELFPPPPGAAAKDKQAKPWVKPPPKIFRIRHKHDTSGRLTELRVLTDDGSEREKYSYNLKERKLEHTVHPVSFPEGFTPRHKPKITSLLDDEGRAVEDVEIFRDESELYRYNVGGETLTGNREREIPQRRVHKYQLDARGNWVRRTTSWLKEDKAGAVEVPLHVIHRTITYY